MHIFPFQHFHLKLETKLIQVPSALTYIAILNQKVILKC